MLKRNAKNRCIYKQTVVHWDISKLSLKNTGNFIQEVVLAWWRVCIADISCHLWTQSIHWCKHQWKWWFDSPTNLSENGGFESKLLTHQPIWGEYWSSKLAVARAHYHPGHGNEPDNIVLTESNVVEDLIPWMQSKEPSLPVSGQWKSLMVLE